MFSLSANGENEHQNLTKGNFLVVQCLGISVCTAGALGWILVQGTKIHQLCSVA